MGHRVTGIGPALRLLRSRAGLSQADIEKRAKLSAGAISDYELCRSEPMPKNLDAILRALDCTWYDLAAALDEAQGRTPQPSEGAPRPGWVSALLLQGSLSVPTAASFAAGLSAADMRDWAGDFIESAAEAGRAIAREAIDLNRRAQG